MKTDSIKTWLKKHWITLIIVAALLIGLGFIFYPTIANFWNNIHQSQAIIDYSAGVSEMTPEDIDSILEEAQNYNQTLCEKGEMDWTLSDAELALYNAVLNYSSTKIMGYVSIDKLHVNLPIYHGTAESILQTSIGHLEGTSLPVGTRSFDPETEEVTDPEEGVHCTISGHRGLPSARLFSDLNKMENGDTFALTVLDEIYTYEVDQILVIEPQELDALVIEKGKDYCTLMTCTPYGVNSHRLLVRGHRVANRETTADISNIMKYSQVYFLPFLLVPALLVIVFNLLFLSKIQKNK